MGTGHARLSPSNARWSKCPGSVREEERYPDISGEAAIDGTGTHLLLEMCLDNNAQPEQYIGQIIGANHEDNPNGWLIQQDRCDRVNVCLTYVQRRHNELSEQYPNCELIIEAESKSDPGGMYGRDDWSGTCDITITVMDGHVCRYLEVIDYKDGRGWVNAAGNTQLISYLGGKARPFIASGPQKVSPLVPGKIGGCRMTIVQPKTMPPIRYENVSPIELVDELEKLYWAALKTDEPDAPLVPGKHCQWCKANQKRGGHCTANSEQSLEVVKTMTNEVTKSDDQHLFEIIQSSMGNLTALESSKLAELADAKDGIVQIFQQVEDEIQKRIELGETISGYAMVPGRMSRQWNADEEEIAKMLKGKRVKKDEMYPAKLITPAAALKLDSLTDKQKNDIEKKYISEVAGKLKLKKVSRKQEDNSAEMMFGDVAEQPKIDEPQTPVEQPAEEISFF